MAKTVVGLMKNAAEAHQVVQELIEAGIDRSKIGMMASGAESGSPAEVVPDDSATDEGVLKGAGTGAVFGGLTGLLAGLVGLAIPGVGPVIASGPIATALAGGGIGAVAGGAISALTNIGVSEEEAPYYTEGLRRGGVLVTVYAEGVAQDDAADDNNIAERSAVIMRRHYVADVGALSGEAETTKRPGGSSGDGFYGDSMRQPVSADASVDDTEARKPPKARHAKANAVLAAALFIGSERRKRDSRYTGIERRAH
ncbi:MAG: hypothetical protein H0V78_05750 [Burkholderiales bacterium]|nr:hypothetical protein [Burkholderiales bacterium]